MGWINKARESMVNSPNCGLNGRIISGSKGLIQLALYPIVSGPLWWWLLPFDQTLPLPFKWWRDLFFQAFGNPNRQVQLTWINGMLCNGSKKELLVTVTVECVWMDGSMAPCRWESSGEFFNATITLIERCVYGGFIRGRRHTFMYLW